MNKTKTIFNHLKILKSPLRQPFVLMSASIQPSETSPASARGASAKNAPQRTLRTSSPALGREECTPPGGTGTNQTHDVVYDAPNKTMSTNPHSCSITQSSLLLPIHSMYGTHTPLSPTHDRLYIADSISAISALDEAQRHQQPKKRAAS